MLETISFYLLLQIREPGHAAGKKLAPVTQQGRGRDRKGVPPALHGLIPSPAHPFLQWSKEREFTEHLPSAHIRY